MLTFPFCLLCLQKQLICMARILLRKTKVVVLDEATSSMDMKTDEQIREVVRRDLVDRTIIAVAHRICGFLLGSLAAVACLTSCDFSATIIEFDHILVLEEGRIIESGCPKDLLADPKSRFSTLARTQGL